MLNITFKGFIMSSISLTEKSNPDTKDIDLMSSLQIVTAINREDQKVAPAIQKVLPQIADAVETIAQAFLNGGRLAYFGAGTSGRIGVLDASECWPTFGVDHGMVSGYIAGGEKALRLSVENAEDSAEMALADLKDFAPTTKDVVVGISANGSPRYVATVMEQAQKIGCKTIAVTSNPNALIKNFSDIFINPIVGEEAITGSSRMKSGTAQKMVLNMLSTGAMIRIGKTYQNYMIDLRVLNEKLQQRAIRFVTEIAGITEKEATEYLKQTDNNVKLACVIAIKKCDIKEAEKLLQQANGILRKVI